MKSSIRIAILAASVGLSLAAQSAHAGDLAFDATANVGSYGVMSRGIHSTMPSITVDGSVTYGNIEGHAAITRAQGQSINGFLTEGKVSAQYNNALDGGKMVVSPKLTYGDINMRTDGNHYRTQYLMAGVRGAYTYNKVFSTFAEFGLGRSFAPSITGYDTCTSGFAYQASTGVKVNAGIGDAVLSIDYKKLPFGNQIAGSNGINLSTVQYNAGYEVKF